MMLAVELSDRAKQVLELQRPSLQPPEVRETSVGLPERARAAAINALERGETHYTDRPGILPLRERVADWLEHHYSVRVDPKTSLVMTCGDTEARFVALQQLLGPGDALLCVGDASLVKPALVIRGANLVEAGAEVESVGLESVKGLYLAATASPDLRDEWLEEAEARGWWIIYDVTADEARSFHPATDPLAEGSHGHRRGSRLRTGSYWLACRLFGRARRGSARPA